MKLKEFVINHIGPFRAGSKFVLEPDVTVITGSNDSGKSVLLQLIKRVATRNNDNPLLQEDVSHEYLSKLLPDWQSDTSISARCIWEADPSQIGGTIDLRALLAPGVWKMEFNGAIKINGTQHSGSFNATLLTQWPKVVLINSEDRVAIRSQFPVASMNPTERALMRIAFDTDFNPQAFEKLKRFKQVRFVEQATDRLNERLRQFLPPTLTYRFILVPTPENNPSIEIGLRDNWDGESTLEQRGSGLRKMVNLLGLLAVESVGNVPTLLLLDEPETSLHADAQHALRYALEALGRHDNIQVVYTTHSPAMINSLRPETIRLLRRRKENGHAVTVVEKRSVDDGFAAVRTSLGVTPADSLLYSPVAVFVEGPTEALCLPLLLRRLSDAKCEGFENANELIGSTQFISVGGDHFGSQATLAKGYGIIPIVYADGDILKKATSQLAKDHSDIRVIAPDDPMHEVEHLVPSKDYFAALEKYLNDTTGKVSADAFKEWDSKAELPEKMMFSKRVVQWVQREIEPNFSSKPEVMLLASRAVALDELRKDTLRRLVGSLREALERSVDPFPNSDAQNTTEIEDAH